MVQKDRFLDRIKITSEIVNKIAQIDEFKGLWHGGIQMSPQILGRLKKSVIITSSGASTRIEGAQMTDEEIARLLGGLKSRSPKNRDEQEVAGYADLIGRIFDNYKTIKLTEGQILQFHLIMLALSQKDQKHKGKYKTTDNVVIAKTERGKNVVLFRPTPPYLVKKEMGDVLNWTEKQLIQDDLHPLLIMCNFIFEFLAIHPFHDGNGRLSRALTNLMLLESNYHYTQYVSLEEIIEDRITDYYLALRVTQKNHKTDHENITPWVHFMLDVLVEHTEKAKSVMQKAEPEKLLSERQTTVYRLFDQHDVLSVADIDRQLEQTIPKATIKHALSRLVHLKLIESIGQGRSTRYLKL